jgi:hypothetical protein
VDVDAPLDRLENDVWSRIDARAQSRAAANTNAAVAGVCALVILVSSAVGVSTAAASATSEPGAFALHQPYAPATALGH